jgi:NhaP-type Na+/H+ or K+/H+ antiporter
MSRWYRSRSFWIVPLVLCVIALLENIVTFKVHEHFRDTRARAAIILALNGIGFGIGAGFLAPGLARVLRQLDRESSQAGTLFTIAFYALTYGLVFYAYLVVEQYGPGGLLPASLR